VATWFRPIIISKPLLEILRLYQQRYPNPTTEIQEKAEAIDLELLIEGLPNLLFSIPCYLGADRIRQIVLSLRIFSRLDEAEMKLVEIHEGL
jgi:signal transduction histidine kinase